jgi:hypothetical protein
MNIFQLVLIGTLFSIIGPACSTRTNKDDTGRTPPVNQEETDEDSNKTPPDQNQPPGGADRPGANERPPSQNSSVPSENHQGGSLPESPFSSRCERFPCFDRQQKIPNASHIVTGISGFDLKRTYEFDFRSGQPKDLRNLGEHVQVALPRGRVLALSNGLTVVRANNGVVVWFKAGVPVYSVATIEPEDVKSGSNFPVGSLALLSNDIVVTASKNGEIRWLKDGKSIFQSKFDRLVNILEMADGTLAVLHGQSISVVDQAKVVSQTELACESINPSIFAALDASTFIVSVKVGGTDVLKLVRSKTELFSMTDFKSNFVLPHSANEFLVAGIHNYRHQNLNKILWIKDQKVVHEHDFEDTKILGQPVMMPDGSLLLSIDPPEADARSRLVKFKNDQLTQLTEVGGGISFDFQVPVVFPDGGYLYFSQSKKISVGYDENVGYSKSLATWAFWPPATLSDGTVVAQSEFGVVQWFSPVIGSVGFFDVKSITTAFKIVRDAGASSICPHVAKSESASSRSVQFTRIANKIELNSKEFLCNGSMTAVISGGRFSLSEYQTSDCRVSLSGIIDANNNVKIEKFHKETCVSDPRVGFNWTVTDLAP